MVQCLEQEFFGGMFMVLEMPWKEENFDQLVGVLRVSQEEEEVGTDCPVENFDQNVGVLKVSLEEEEEEEEVGTDCLVENSDQNDGVLKEEVGTDCPSSLLPHKWDCSALCPCLSSQFRKLPVRLI
jgi:hypothetical protein